LRLDAIAGAEFDLASTVSRANSGSAILSARPKAADVAALAAGHAGFAGLLSANPGARVEALGPWSPSDKDVGATTQLVELDITLDRPADEGNVALAISNVSAAGGGFDSLRFRLEVLGELFGEEVTFGSVEEADAYFSTAFLLGQAYSEPFSTLDVPAIRAIFEVMTSLGHSVTVGVAAVVVPEPSVALLLGMGLLLCASSKSASSSRPIDTRPDGP